MAETADQKRIKELEEQVNTLIVTNSKLTETKPADTTIYQGAGAPRHTDLRNEDGTWYKPKEAPTMPSDVTADATSA